MARDQDDTFRPETDVERRADPAEAARHDPTLAPDAHPEAADPGGSVPRQATESPSSGAHAAVEAPRGKVKPLWMVVGAVVAITLAFLLLGGVAEEAAEGEETVISD